MARNLGLIRQNYNLLFTKPQFRQIFRNYAKLKPKVGAWNFYVSLLNLTHIIER